MRQKTLFSLQPSAVWRGLVSVSVDNQNKIFTITRRHIVTEETYRPFPHYAPVSKNKEMRTRLGWTCNFIQITVFCSPEPELVPLFTGMRKRSIHSKWLTRVSLRASFLGRSGRLGRKRKESLQLCLWNLNICIKKVDAKFWLAEMTEVMMLLPLAHVLQMLVYVRPRFWFALMGRNLTAQ